MREFGHWSEQTSSTGRKYYYNNETEVSQWEKPREWRDHEQRFEAERQDQQRMQPIPPPPYYPNYQYPSGLPPPPGFPGFPGPPPPHYANPFVPPAIPPLPPPPRRDAPRTSTPARGGAVPTARNYSRPSPSSSQGPPQRYDARVANSQSDSSRPPQREDQNAPHPYATPQPLMGQPYRDQTTPRRVQQRESHESDREKTRSAKRELEAGPSEDRAVKRPAKEEEERPEQQYQYQQPEETSEQEAQEGNEEWRPYYRHDLSQRKAAELHLEDDSELADIRCLELENKWQKAEIQAKEAVAKRMVLQHEVEMTNMRIESCRQQQREIEMRAAQPVFLTGERRKEHLQQLLKRLQAMKTT